MTDENDKTKLSILLDAGRLGYGTLVEQIAGVIRGFIVPGLLGPALYGILGGLNLILQYGQYADLGVTNGLYREIPMYKKRGDDASAAGLTRSSFSFNLLTAVIPSILIVVVALVLRQRIRDASFWGLVAFAFVFILFRLTLYFQTYLKAIADFKSAGRSIALRAVISLATVVFLTYLYGIYGLYVGLIISGIVVFIYVAMKSRVRPALIPERRYLKELLRVGVPFFVVNSLSYLLISIDRVAVFNLMSKADMGYYTLAAVITSFVFAVPMNVGQVLGPRVFGVPRDGDLIGFRSYILKPTVLMTIFASLVGGAAVLFLIPFIRYALPDYGETMALIPPMFVAFTVLNGTHGSGLILVALHRFRALAVGNLLAAGFIGSTAWMVISRGLPLFWVAVAGAVGITAYSVFLQLAACRVLSLPGSAAAKAVFYLFFPPALMAGALFLAFFGSNFLLGPVTPSPVPVARDLTYLGARLIIYALAAAGLLYYIERRTGVIKLTIAGAVEKISGRPTFNRR